MSGRAEPEHDRLAVLPGERGLRARRAEGGGIFLRTAGKDTERRDN